MALWFLKEVSKKGEEEQGTSGPTAVLSGAVCGWLLLRDSGLDVGEAVNWQKQGHRFRPLPRQQWSSFTVGGGVLLPRDRNIVKMLVQQPTFPKPMTI